MEKANGVHDDDGTENKALRETRREEDKKNKNS